MADAFDRIRGGLAQFKNQTSTIIIRHSNEIIYSPETASCNQWIDE
jgi:hypothetical protein